MDEWHHIYRDPPPKANILEPKKCAALSEHEVTVSTVMFHHLTVPLQACDVLLNAYLQRGMFHGKYSVTIPPNFWDVEAHSPRFFVSYRLCVAGAPPSWTRTSIFDREACDVPEGQVQCHHHS